MASNPEPVLPPERHHHYYAPPTVEASGAATASLVLGIIALVCSIIPIIGLISWLLAPAAVITSLFGLNNPVNKGSAIGGLISGILAFIVCIGWVLLIAIPAASLGTAHAL
jgi:Mg2+ and Co2+ transporter CorA